MYHPRVFKKNIPKSKPSSTPDAVLVEKELSIPENTLYEEPLVRHTKPSKRHITVFGFSQNNLENVVRKIKEVCHVQHMEYGKNWVNVITPGETELLRLNTKYINGEMIGVYREVGNAVVDDKDIFLRKEGIIGKILSYFFGE
ncbi:nucleoporin NUP35 [Vairimorpha necatrix]|uniref:Nucleoporin NUP35 n=1 Tax=Vairimorpha necatrix TaxID=6039 RepID=A0AAX4JB00_9MICR